MTHIKLKSADLSRQQISEFKRTLAAHAMRIADEREDFRDGTLEIYVDAGQAPTTRTVHGAAFDIFGDAMLSIRSHLYQASVVLAAQTVEQD